MDEILQLVVYRLLVYFAISVISELFYKKKHYQLESRLTESRKLVRVCDIFYFARSFSCILWGCS